MNPILFEYEFPKKETVFSITENQIKFISGREITFQSIHDQECCERVYADWSSAKYVLMHLTGKEIIKFTIKGIEGEGFLICFNDSFTDEAKVFIPCYNEQNGYYSSELTLLITVKDDNSTSVSRIDISNFEEDSKTF